MFYYTSEFRTVDALELGTSIKPMCHYADQSSRLPYIPQCYMGLEDSYQFEPKAFYGNFIT